MLNIDMRTVLRGHLSRYSLVTGVAKRAREIEIAMADEKKKNRTITHYLSIMSSSGNIMADEKEKNRIITEKPVTLALEELKQGLFEIEEPEEIRNL